MYVFVRNWCYSAVLLVDDTAGGTAIGGIGTSSSSLPRSGLDIDGDERLQLARKLLLTTEWIVEAGQKHGQVKEMTRHNCTHVSGFERLDYLSLVGVGKARGRGKRCEGGSLFFVSLYFTCW